MAGFNPVGSTPVGAIGSGGALPGTYVAPNPAVISLAGEQGYVNSGIRISKANFSIESHPPVGIYISKGNFAVESHPTPGTYISKVNFALESTKIPSTSKGSVSIIWG